MHKNRLKSALRIADNSSYRARRRFQVFNKVPTRDASQNHLPKLLAQLVDSHGFFAVSAAGHRIAALPILRSLHPVLPGPVGQLPAETAAAPPPCALAVGARRPVGVTDFACRKPAPRDTIRLW
jgi:hypothetical protein